MWYFKPSSLTFYPYSGFNSLSIVNVASVSNQCQFLDATLDTWCSRTWQGSSARDRHPRHVGRLLLPGRPQRAHARRKRKTRQDFLNLDEAALFFIRFSL